VKAPHCYVTLTLLGESASLLRHINIVM
jgi:hypothetical protein